MGYGGKTLHKSVQVITNDPNTPEYKLSISGKVEEFVSIKPRHVRFTGNPGKPQKAIVTIVPQKKYPFVISNTRANHGEWIEHAIEPWESEGKKGYQLIVTNLKKEPGNYRDVIILTTNSPIQPEIRINVFAALNTKDSKDTKKKNTPVTPGNQAFIDLIKKLQTEQKNKPKTTQTTTPSPEQSENVKKLFEQLIKKNQQKQDTQSNIKVIIV